MKTSIHFMKWGHFFQELRNILEIITCKAGQINL